MIFENIQDGKSRFWEILSCKTWTNKYHRLQQVIGKYVRIQLDLYEIGSNQGVTVPEIKNSKDFYIKKILKRSF